MNNKQDIKKVLEENPKVNVKELAEILCKMKKIAYDDYFVCVLNQVIEANPELKKLVWNVVGYGINIGHIQSDGDIEYERYTTVDTLEEAEVVFNVLTADIETSFWDEVQIEKIWERGDEGDYDYDEVKRGWPNQGMLNKTYWNRVKTLNHQIFDFTIEADYEDNKPLNICWLKLGYISPDSGVGFFYYSSVSEFKKLLRKVRYISDSDITVSDIKQYLSWLESNECLFDASKSQIEQISDMLYGYKKKQKGGDRNEKGC